ncbi:YheT family hydrolase [Portibacter lacus]|uniref:Alpha/beta hydrolase n=1 Tax=Portibacter lacus TaxID=1099794 RepID=A0AA37SZ87_9BACT|nr:alpha/beta fold hydrolase [Portibacter lacus]GLR20135.1 alpha/beta hydrolase [Portibacter lacus]
MQEYRPSVLLRNGHINTIYTSLFRNEPEVKFERKRISTYDEDFLDLDLITQNSKKVVILCHGLEGSSGSKYISGTSHLLSENGYDICAMNYRYCSGEINRTPQLYHSGYTPDLHCVIESIESDYEEIYLVGFSLGGNLILKYLGEKLFARTSKLKQAVAISAPVDLKSSSMQMLKFENKLYTNRFLKTLNQKVKEKHKQYPELFDLKYIPKVKTVYDFDDYYTGPLNGFKDADDYYAQCSSRQFLPRIEIPTMLLNSKDDPFLGIDCYPSKEEVKNDLMNLKYSKYGGHVGFYQKGSSCWDEEKVLEFFSK